MAASIFLVVSAATKAPGQTVTSVTGTSNQINASPTTGNVVLSIPAPVVFPGKFIATASSGSNASARFPSGTAPTTPVAGDFFNVSQVLKIYDGSTTQSLITDGGNSLTATSIPTIVATKTNQLTTTGPTIDASSNLGSVNAANGTGDATFNSFIATGSSLGAVQFFNPSGTNSVTLTPAVSPTSSYTLSTPDTGGANDTLVSLAATQTLTNKTLTTPAITNPTITNSGGERLLPR